MLLRNEKEMTYTDRSACGQGWEDAKAGKLNNNPFHPEDFRWDCYEWGYNTFTTHAYAGQPAMSC